MKKPTIKNYEKITDSDIVTEPERESRELLEALNDTEAQLQDYYVQMAKSEDPEACQEDVVYTMRSHLRASANLLKAHHRLLSMTDELSARWNDLSKSKHRLLSRVPANSVIDLEETSSGHFAAGLNWYKVLWICFIGSFAGVIVELLWCLVTRGYLESRSGLVYGPFNLLYGAGAVAMTVTLYRYRNKGRWLSFLGGFLVGSVVEYACSWGQEMIFGSTSWDYSAVPFNLNGRICFLYSLFWGVLGILWMKYLYPLMAEWILKIPNKWGKILTWAVTAFFIFNAIVSAIAVFRWSQRIDLIEPANAFWAFIDTRFPDSRMERIYANMVFS